MIVDFPEVKRQLYQAIGQLVIEYVKASLPLLTRLGVRRQHEGEVHDYGTMDGERKRMEYLQHSFGVTFDQAEFESLRFDDVAVRMLGAAQQMAASMGRAFVDTITAATEATGNVLRSGDFSDPENIIRAMESMPIDFNGSRDSPQFQVMADPNTLAELRRRLGAMSEEERADHIRRCNEVLDRKYAEYLSRENNRKLVD